jgi:hypothetical protein
MPIESVKMMHKARKSVLLITNLQRLTIVLTNFPKSLRPESLIFAAPLRLLRLLRPNLLLSGIRLPDNNKTTVLLNVTLREETMTALCS